MKAEYINPFLESVNELFTTMLASKVKRGSISLSSNNSMLPRSITALIGLSGRARGTVAMSFPVQTALAMTSKLIGGTHAVLNAEVSDAMAEMVNIVAGNAKAKLSKGGEPINLSLPSVVKGENFTIEPPSQAQWLDIPFESDLGPFSLRVTFEFAEERRK
jgi:chemotaxis protein CheX